MPTLSQWIHVASMVLSGLAGLLVYIGYPIYGGAVALFLVPTVNSIGLFLSNPSAPPAAGG